MYGDLFKGDLEEQIYTIRLLKENLENFPIMPLVPGYPELQWKDTTKHPSSVCLCS